MNPPRVRLRADASIILVGRKTVSVEGKVEGFKVSRLQSFQDEFGERSATLQRFTLP